MFELRNFDLEWKCIVKAPARHERRVELQIIGRTISRHLKREDIPKCNF